MGWTLDDSANNFPWRVGRKLGRTVYAQEGDAPSDDDPLLGLMETEEIARQVVVAVNRSLEVGRQGSTAEAPAEPNAPTSNRRAGEGES